MGPGRAAADLDLEVIVVVDLLDQTNLTQRPRAHVRHTGSERRMEGETEGETGRQRERQRERQKKHILQQMQK